METLRRWATSGREPCWPSPRSAGGTLDIAAAPARIAGLEEHVLVTVRKVGRTAPGWPRPPAERKRHPW